MRHFQSFHTTSDPLSVLQDAKTASLSMAAMQSSVSLGAGRTAAPSTSMPLAGVHLHHRQATARHCKQPFHGANCTGIRRAVALRVTPSSGQQAATGAAAAEAPDRRAGRMTYKPASYAELVSHAVNSVLEAIRDGDTRMEVEFPPVPIKVDGA